ncbi:MAG: TetR/AcrR family transcriptional regulator [Acidimicrobiaceae bacterium]|nr:TetR/AcrR family transcriptional regulator [Acidimicrobiaceae bacterium]
MRSLPGEERRAPAGAEAGRAVRSPRERILTAVAEISARDGYQALTREKIAGTARVSHSTFRELFGDKEEAFSAVQREIVEQAEQALAEVPADLAWPERIRAGVEALLGLAAEDPELARAFLAESRPAGPRATAFHDESLARLVPALREGRKLESAPDELPERMEEGIIGGAAWHLSERLDRAAPDEVRELGPDLVAIVLSPYIGKREAAEVAGGS